MIKSQLVNEFIRITEDIRSLQILKKALTDQISRGRTFGDEMDLYRSPDSVRREYSAHLLRMHVPHHLLDKCVVNRRSSGSVRIVDKLKPKKPKAKK